MLFLSVVLALLSILIFSTTVMAQDVKPDNAVGFYIQDGQLKWIIPGEGIRVDKLARLTPTEIEKLHPMTPQKQANIVQRVPACPVIIDGVRYSPDQISRFNGKRLRFIWGKDNNLYAFTTVLQFEQFQRDNFGDLTGQSVAVAYSYFYKDAQYTGIDFGLLPGYGLPLLSAIGMDKAISSAMINTSTQWAYLFDSTDYQGNYFGMPPGSSYPWLINQGWNDRASSVWINQ
jgi:hypothetical protein